MPKSVQVTVLSGVVVPGVVAKVGAVVPLVPATVTLCTLPVGSRMTWPTVYAVLAVHVAVGAVAVGPLARVQLAPAEPASLQK